METHNLGLVFDIGANVGNFTQEALDYGTRKVLAVEANNKVAAGLRARFGGDQRVIIVEVAVSDGTASQVPFYLAPSADTVSTCSTFWSGPESRFANIGYAAPIMVPATTLSNLIREYGVPDLLKIDVEGYEKAVIAGLGQKVPLLCFEWAEEVLEDMIACIIRLTSLGFTSFSLQNKDPYMVCPAAETFMKSEAFLIHIIKTLLPARKTEWGMIWCY